MSGLEKLSPTPVARTVSAKSKNAAPPLEPETTFQTEPLFEHRHWFSIGILESIAIHRFRNLFMSMMGNISFAREEVKNGRSPEKYLNDLDRSLNDASQYSTWLQLYAEKPKPQFCSVNLNQLVREAIDTISQTKFSSLKISFVACEHIPNIIADPFLLKLCIWELISEYQKSANEKMPTLQNAHKAASLSIDLNDESKSSACNPISPKDARKHVILNFKSSELNITTQNQNCVPQTSSTKSSCTSPAIEIAKFIVRLFHGEISCQTAAEYEQISLSFQIEPER